MPNDETIRRLPRRSNLKDMTAMRFGMLTVIGWADGGRWLCQCDCGERSVIRGTHLRTGNNRSCGCLGRASRMTHGMTKTPTYDSWRNIIYRCCNPQSDKAKDYIDRGISVCDRWRNSFELFLADMGECPPGLAIDRIDNDGDYEPGNCRWATQTEQQRNRRTNHRIACFGEEKTLVEWGEDARCIVTADTLLQRLRRGWNSDDAITRTPVARGHRTGLSHV